MSRRSGFGPSIVGGKLRYLSVSQLSKFDAEEYGGCPRKWWFSYIAGKPEPEIKAQRLGKQVHSQIEHYLKTGENVLGPIALSGFRFLPKPKTVDVEVPIGKQRDGQIVSGLTCAGVPVVGFVDCVNASGTTQDDAGETVVESFSVEAVDWKTTGQIDDETDLDTGIVIKRGLAKTANQLSRTHQMVGYGEWLRRRHPEVTSVRLSHGIFQTKGMRLAVKRSALVTVEEIRRRWRRSERVAEEMKAAARVKDVTTLPANMSACSAYRGCPFTAECPRDAKAILASMYQGGSYMGLLDKIRQRNDGTAVVGLVVPISGPPTQAEVVAETAKLAAEESAMRTAAIVPPDVPEPTPQLAVVEVTKLETVEPVKKPRKTKVEKATAEVLEQHTHTLARLSDGITLYLNCAEDGVATERLETYAHALADELAAAAGAPDIRCASGEILGFGKWRGVLAARAKTSPPAPGAYTVSTTDELAAVVAEALAPTATRVVRGRP